MTDKEVDLEEVKKKLSSDKCKCSLEFVEGKWKLTPAPTQECEEMLKKLDSESSKGVKEYMAKHIKTNDPKLKEIVERMGKRKLVD